MTAIFNDDWDSAALTDDTLVADLLITFKKKTVSLKSHATFRLTWGLKKPRSNSATRPRLRHADVFRCGGAGSTRFSPTTPLSWSGAASHSDTGDGNGVSNRHHAARSKATATSGFTGNSGSTKKCKRKKTFAELKEEESSLLKERVYLEKEIANKNAIFEVEKAKNERMKRMKLDCSTKWNSNPSSSKSVEVQCTPIGQPHQRIVEVALKVTHATEDEYSHSQVSKSKRDFFLIPDLNMMPPDDDSYTEDLSGMS